MGKDTVRLEVTLDFRRRGREKPFTGEVTRVWTHVQQKWLTVVSENLYDGIAMISVTTDDVVIRSITLYEEACSQGYTELYSEDEHDQVEAFETIVSIFEEGKITSPIKTTSTNEEEEKEVPNLAGPKRIEAILRKGSAEIRLVVTDVMSPAGFYESYSVTGREWRDKVLCAKVSTCWSSDYQLIGFEAFLGGLSGSSLEMFEASDQERAWATLEKMVSKFKPSEITVIKNWSIANVEDEDDGLSLYSGAWYGPNHRSQHWTNRAPASYAPKEACFRVSGDEAGAEIHREQLEAWVESGSPSPEKLLEEILRVEIPEGVSETSKAENTGNAENVCSDCGQPGCPIAYCLKDEEFLGFEGIAMNGSFTVH